MTDGQLLGDRPAGPQRDRRAMPLGTLLAVLLGRLAGALSRLAGRGRGGTLPGRIVLHLRPDALAELSRGMTVLLVSGTNGKSTTTRLLSAALAPLGPVTTNADGANLLSGVVGALMQRDPASTLAVLEVDEVVLPAVLVATGAAVVVLLNLSRDQLDRVEEVATHVARWSQALRCAPHVRVVANADDPLVVSAVLDGRVAESRRRWVRIGSPWRGDAAMCPRCGRPWEVAGTGFRCGACGLEAPPAGWSLEGDRLVGADGTALAVQLALPGRASAADACLAAVAAAELGVEPAAALDRMRDVRDVDGRYLLVQVSGRSVRLLLAKNPAGWLEVIDELGSGDEALLLGINARTADGTDPSWLWDVPFERLGGRRVVVFGERRTDLSVRLHYAEVEYRTATDLEQALALAPDGPVVVAANYTAFTQARDRLLAQPRLRRAAAGPCPGR